MSADKGIIFPVSMDALRKVEENLPDSIKLLRVVSLDEETGLPSTEVNPDFDYSRRSLIFDGKRGVTEHSSVYDPLRPGYSQDVCDLTSHLSNKTLFAKVKVGEDLCQSKAKFSRGTVFRFEDGQLGLTGVAQGVRLEFTKNKAGFTKQGSGLPAATVPGEIFVRAAFLPNIGTEIKSVRVSNQLLKGLLEYTPIRDHGSSDAGNSTLKFSPLVIYGLEIIDTSGSVNYNNLKEAIKYSRQEENAAEKQLELVMREFCNNPKLRRILELTQAHLIPRAREVAKKGDIAARDQEERESLNVATIDSAMAIAIFRDLPLVLENKKDIAACPALLNAMVWCGVPELSAAIKEALQDVIDADQDRFKRLGLAYGVGDDTADLAQFTLDAIQENERFTKNCSEITSADEEGPIVKAMEEIRESKKKDIEQGHIMHEPGQDGLIDSHVNGFAGETAAAYEAAFQAAYEAAFQAAYEAAFQAAYECAVQAAYEAAFQAAYECAVQANEGFTKNYSANTIADSDSANPIVEAMEEIRKSTKEAIEQGHITYKVAAETLHKVNQELINCTRYLALPQGAFRPVTEKKDWNEIANDAMKAASPKKKWASRILMGVGIVLAVGFGAALAAGFLVATGGLGAVPLAAVGVAVGSVVSPTIAAAAVGVVAASSIGMSVGLAYSRRKDVEKVEKFVRRVFGAEKAFTVFADAVVDLAPAVVDPAITEQQSSRAAGQQSSRAAGQQSNFLPIRR